MDARAGRKAWGSFAGAPPSTRAFLALRLALLATVALDDELLALRGHVLSLGSGHGLLERYLASINPHVEVVGYELDQTRVDVAAASASRFPQVRIERGDVTKLPAGGAFDAALAVDVLHHVPADAHPRLARALAGQLRPGAICLVKDIGRSPGWKFRWNTLHDRIVAGHEVHCREPEDMAAAFDAAGFTVERVERVAHSSPYPHYLIRAVKRT